MLSSRTVILAEAICMTIRAEFRVPTDLFLFFAHDHSTKIYGPLSFNLSFVHDHLTKIYGLLSFIFLLCTTIRPWLRVLTDLFFYLHTIIRQKCIFLFHLFFLLFATIRPKLGSSLIYLFYLYPTIRPNYMVLFHLLFLYFVHDHSTKN